MAAGRREPHTAPGSKQPLCPGQEPATVLSRLRVCTCSAPRPRPSQPPRAGSHSPTSLGVLPATSLPTQALPPQRPPPSGDLPAARGRHGEAAADAGASQHNS